MAHPTADAAVVFGFDQQHPTLTTLDPADHRLNIPEGWVPVPIASLDRSGGGVECGPVTSTAHTTITADLQLQALQTGCHPGGHVSQSFGLPRSRKLRQIVRQGAIRQRCRIGRILGWQLKQQGGHQP